MAEKQTDAMEAAMTMAEAEAMAMRSIEEHGRVNSFKNYGLFLVDKLDVPGRLLTVRPSRSRQAFTMSLAKAGFNGRVLACRCRQAGKRESVRPRCEPCCIRYSAYPLSICHAQSQLGVRG